jgi:hypothetical protein
MALYVILDPAFEYAVSMVKFLDTYDLKGIAVFTDEGQYQLFHNVFIHQIGHCIADEYLLSQFPSLQALAEQILEDLEDEELQGIIPWDEMSIELGAELGEYLDLDWNSLEVIHRFRNKFDLKEYLRSSTDLRINASQVVTTVEEAEEFVNFVGRWPIVVKPTEGSGSKGVFFAESPEELLTYCVESFKTGQGDILLEEFIGGKEFVINGITNAAGEVLITDAWHYDKRESHGIKNLYFETLKVNRTDYVFEPLAVYAGKLIQTLGLRKSPFHMELKLDERGPCLVECGARFAGGNQPLLASMLHEHSLFEVAACHYLADFSFDLEDLHYDRYDRLQARIIKGVQSEEIPVIQEVHGLDEVQSLASFGMIGFVRPVGSYLPVTTDLLTASFEVYLIHEDPQQIAEDAVRVRELLWYEG